METDLAVKKKEFQEKKGQLAELRSQLHSLHNEKEAAFKELKVLQEASKNRALQIKTIREERSNLVEQIKTFKEERQKLYAVAKEKSSEKEKLEEKKNKASHTLRIRETPQSIRQTIARLEMKIVTDVLSFEKEQQLRKHIKDLQEKSRQGERLIEMGREMNSTAASLSQSRRKAEEAHQQVQKIAQLAQEKYEQINALYTELKKRPEKEVAERYFELKRQYLETKQKMDDVMARCAELNKILKQENEHQISVKLREKSAEVQEKIKKGKKLSTEDILAFQATKE